MEDISVQSLVVALLMTVIAGMGTGIGVFLSVLPQAREGRFLAGALGFSAGVMLYVSFLDLMPQAMSDMAGVYDPHYAELYSIIAFFCGVILIAVIDFLVPENDNPHEYNHVEVVPTKTTGKGRAGLMLALAIGIHNFPEGMATFVSALDGATVAVPIVIAIMLHNIPEGIAVAVPVYNATGSHRKALVWSVLSGFAEPLGAVAGMLFLVNVWSPVINALLLAAVAGVMVYIAIDELLPGAESYGHHHVTIICVILGMITIICVILGMMLMAASMLMI